MSTTAEVRSVQVGGQQLRVAVRPGLTGPGPGSGGQPPRVPLLLMNGIGASLETFQPFIDTLDPSLDVIRFDAPGVGGSGQIGDWSNPQSDALINASVSGTDPAAVTAEASFFTTKLPVLWQPVRDRVWAWKTNISATDPTAFENLTQYDNTPQFWYLNK